MKKTVVALLLLSGAAFAAERNYHMADYEKLALRSQSPKVHVAKGNHHAKDEMGTKGDTITINKSTIAVVTPYGK